MVTPSSNVSGGVFQLGQGEQLRYGDTTVTFRIIGSEVDGAVLVWERETPPGAEIQLHMHRVEDEFIILLRGELEVSIGGVVQTVHTGDTVKMPRGVPHAIRTTGSVMTRSIWLAVPAGNMADMFRALAALSPEQASDPATLAMVYLDHNIVPIEGDSWRSVEDVPNS